MKRAAIDIGTNSVRLLTCQLEGKRLNHRQKYVEMTRIGKGVDQTGRLDDTRMQQTIDVLKHYRQKLDALQIKQCMVFATSAVRDASNSADFVDIVRRQTGFELAVIDGQTEAYFGFLGVVKGLKQTTRKILVIDIGGGSTELIYGDATGKIIESDSLNIGAVRLTDRFNLAHPVSEEQVKQVQTAVLEALEGSMMRALKQVDYDCVGIGGTATTLGAMALMLKDYDPQRIHNYKLSTRAITAFVNELSTTSREYKQMMTGLPEKRVDIITAGTIILQTIQDYLKQSAIYLSDYDNLEGAIFDAE